jgi:hypothetical protein
MFAQERATRPVLAPTMGINNLRRVTFVRRQVILRGIAQTKWVRWVRWVWLVWEWVVVKWQIIWRKQVMEWDSPKVVVEELVNYVIVVLSLVIFLETARNTLPDLVVIVVVFLATWPVIVPQLFKPSPPSPTKPLNIS